MDKTTEQKQEPSNAFTRLLSEFREGESIAELSEALQACVAAARDTSKVAELKYTVKFTPSGNAIVVTDKVEIKLPVVDRDQAILRKWISLSSPRSLRKTSFSLSSPPARRSWSL